MSDIGTEFDLLARLEEALDMEMQTATVRSDKARKDRVSRLQKSKRIELEATARKKSEREEHRSELGSDALQARAAMQQLGRDNEARQEAVERRRMGQADTFSRAIEARYVSIQREKAE